MSKVSIATIAEAPVVTSFPGSAGDIESRSLFAEDSDPIHAHAHRLAHGSSLRIGPVDTDSVVYVWTGAVEAGGQRLAAGSSLVTERGATVEIVGLDATSQLVVFRASRPPPTARAGGHVHLLPNERVRRMDGIGAPGVIGGMHANAACPTCTAWLHENFLPGRELAPDEAPKGIHAHSEDEVVFVVEGSLRFGTRTLAPGSAIAIAADAFYAIGPAGPEGLKIVNFRAAQPSEIRFKGGGSMDEVALWREIAVPNYVETLAS
jgi:hypothetical protein